MQKRHTTFVQTATILKIWIMVELQLTKIFKINIRRPITEKQAGSHNLDPLHSELVKPNEDGRNRPSRAAVIKEIHEC